MLLLLTFPTSRLASQISPGPLARPHRELEGTASCVRCHSGGRGALSAQCVACHKDIGWLAEQARGFHGTAAVRAATCASCHPDHAGAGFELVKWPEGSADRFDHRRTGWPLSQSHAQAKCTDCHTDKFQTGPARTRAAGGQGGTWTGLETTCTACHEDTHRGALGGDCRQCHDAGRWATTPGFQHDTTGYPLTNKHAAVACDKCHLAAAIATRRDPTGHLIPVYRPVPHAACTDCHKDPHAGRLGETCTGCHTTRGFQQIDRGNFDHERTRYPLRGKHASTRCAACHGDFSTPALKQPPAGSCASCHKDAHNRTARLAGAGDDCATCHTVSGFAPGRLTLAQHARTKYPLEGKHAQVACAACHGKDTSPGAEARWGNARVVLQPASATCRSCHADDHGTQLAARPDSGECAACHTLAGWVPSRFDVAAHAQLRFPLQDRHAALACAACHGSLRPGLPPLPRTAAMGRVAFRFRIPEVECAACHQDPHRGRYASGGALPVVGGCAACHDARRFRPATVEVATHGDYGFALEGAHRATPCLACHETIAASGESRPVLLRQAAVRSLSLEAPTACAECHQTPHGGQFASREDRGRCEACHSAERFRPADRFNHDRDTRFRLRGGHERVPCNRCHPSDVTAAGGVTLRYRPVSAKCESCHAGKEAR